MDLLTNLLINSLTYLITNLLISFRIIKPLYHSYLCISLSAILTICYIL